MPDICPTCGERWCTDRHRDPWAAGLCLRCGASWHCACRGGGDAAGDWRIDGGTTLRAAMRDDSVNDRGNLRDGANYRRTVREDAARDAQYAAVSGGHVRPSDNPTIWPRPGWREQAAA